MPENRPPSVRDADGLLALAERGGPGAASAARRAAALLEPSDPARARHALALAVQLSPLDPAPRLGLARLAAESGDVVVAKAEAEAVLASGADADAKARAAFMLGEIARQGGAAAEARELYAQTMKLQDGILANNRSDPAAARWYARARGRVAELDASAGEFDRAKSGAQAALALLRAIAAQTGETPELAADIGDAELRLGALELDSNQPSSARRRFGEAIGRYEALAVTEKEEPHWRAVLADAWAIAAEADYVRGAPDAARDAMDRSLQVRLRLAAKDPRESWALAGTWRVRAALRAALGDHDAAAESIAQARALAEQLHARDRLAEAPARFLVRTLLDGADHALRAGELAVAREAANEARALAERFASASDASAGWLADASACWDRMGEIARSAGASSQDAFARAAEMRRMACERAPGEVAHTRGLAAALVKHGEAALAEHDHATARMVFGESAVLRAQLIEEAPGDRSCLHALAVALERLGLAAQAMGDLAAARDAWEEELALAFRLFDENDIEGVRFCAIVESHLAGAGGAHAETHRRSALERFDALAHAGVLTEREAALRKRLWGGP
jgi:tetratricopeptide (TPR) repeat protein